MNAVVSEVIYAVLAVIFSGLMAFLLTPLVRVLAYKVKAIDVPRDERRMHKKPTPRLGGLAIFLAFELTILLFCDLDRELSGLLIGAFIIAVIGVLDDIFRISAVVKLIGQTVAACVPALMGVTISHITIFGQTIVFDKIFNNFSFVVTVFWIVAVTNAINLIDGLDGLACGISTISAISIMLFAVLEVDAEFSYVILWVAILLGACLGFMPYNRHPASIFMGDTGALFLGYTLAVVSIQGVFKFNAVASFWTPFLIFGIPLLDTFTSTIRRIIKGHSPFQADRGHFHHKLIDLGFSQKQAVNILYAISALFGISAVLFTKENKAVAFIIILASFVVGFLNYKLLLGSKSVREQMGLDLNTSDNEEDKNKDK